MNEQVRRKPKTWVIVGIVVGLFLLFSFGSLMFLVVLFSFSSEGGGWGERVGIIRVSGEIAGSSGISLFGSAAGAEETIKLIRKTQKDEQTQALVLRINSPGGSAAASQEIYQAIRRFKEATGKPVVASMSDTAASGGYYVACAADKIVADPATLTGSIGVIMQLENFEEVMKKVGVRFDALKSGKHKDIGSPFRGLTDEERKIMQTLIMDVYDQFVNDVAQGRKMKVEQVRKLADGRVFTGRQAKRLGLVDELGGLHEAVALAGKLGGISGEPQTYEYKHIESLMDVFVSSVAQGVRLEIRDALRGRLRQGSASLRLE